VILEVADIRIGEGRQAEFEAAIAHGLETVISKAKGYRRSWVQRGIESPARFLLFIEWETLEDHTVGFRESPAFAAWRGIVGPFFAEPPKVEHFERVVTGPQG
jgi:heme-degrading monooxygenase HmoA